jgi:hypothetical protein
VRWGVGAVLAAGLVAGCAGEPGPRPTAAAGPTTAAPTTAAPTTVGPTSAGPTTAGPTTAGPSTAAPVAGGGASAAPGWLGTRVLPAGPAGYPLPRPTPPELVDRRIATVDDLPPPPDGRFRSTVTPVPPAVEARSTWTRRCPVTLAELRYVTVTFRGFDGRPHTGELLVHRDVADAAVAAFRDLYGQGFPIERMRVTGPAELAAPPTGDGNTTAAFVCRPARGSRSWSAHAYGKAVDLNPFQNPYRAGDRVIPELATAYLDRDRHRPGMVTAAVVAAWRAVGWQWGGDWTAPTDLMHFTATGH